MAAIDSAVGVPGLQGGQQMWWGGFGQRCIKHNRKNCCLPLPGEISLAVTTGGQLNEGEAEAEAERDGRKKKLKRAHAQMAKKQGQQCKQGERCKQDKQGDNQGKQGKQCKERVKEESSVTNKDATQN